MEFNWLELLSSEISDPENISVSARLDGEPEPSLAVVSPLADGGGGSGGDNTFQNAEHPHQGQLVDWDTLQIVERQDEEEGRMELIDEDQMYVLLGLRDEDDKADQAAKEAVAAASADGDKGKAPAMEDTHGAAIPVDDDIPGERMILYDPNKPSMDLAAQATLAIVFRTVTSAGKKNIKRSTAFSSSKFTLWHNCASATEDTHQKPFCIPISCSSAITKCQK
ncbi:hypothetical protein PVAP13_9KG411951 [Panicum virgatum]|uniref:Uncharacterized protein n=1 Tax=Panicum virgatum TaxID=38727 RepID=A0A8T0NNY6_PANVG|nr:hypothetical protein PVAP13_9KG411951 [Panicum virgatum]